MKHAMLEGLSSDAITLFRNDLSGVEPALSQEAQFQHLAERRLDIGEPQMGERWLQYRRSFDCSAWLRMTRHLRLIEHLRNC